jgi:hypothetical protein
MYAKELKLVSREKLTHYRELAYRLWGKARAKMGVEASENQTPRSR